jgi:undecaprenyl diphosphate synthase
MSYPYVWKQEQHMPHSKKIDYEKLPAHIAIVMDGNGRWAQQRSLPRLAGHNAGMKTLKNIVKASSQIGIKYLTVYAFSTENWKRPEEEVRGIFKLLILYIEKELKELHSNNVKVMIIGDYRKLPEDAITKLETSLETTKNNTGLQFNIALNYGSRAEIIKSVIELSQLAVQGELKPENINDEVFSAHLYTKGIPDPDLVIRTSGEIRLSNFLLWQTAYSEFWFTDLFWPDFGRKDLETAILDYQSRKRRYGGVKE